jgi:hypothetical protein
VPCSRIKRWVWAIVRDFLPLQSIEILAVVIA